MSKRKRNIGLEIRDGLRELKRGDYGRVINIPDVAKSVSVSACRSPGLRPCLVSPFARCRTGNRGAARHPVLLGRFSWLPIATRAPCSRLPEACARKI